MKFKSQAGNRRVQSLVQILTDLSKKSFEKTAQISLFILCWFILFLGWNTWINKPAPVNQLENPIAPTYWNFPRIHHSFNGVDLRKISLMEQNQFEYLLKQAVPSALRPRFSKIVKISLAAAEKYQGAPLNKKLPSLY
jgi:hypothetical protein